MADMADMKSIPVGMDLGTSYSCVATCRDGQAVTIPNDQGQRITPSIVCFHDGDRLVGEGAATQWSVFPTNTICDAKRMIGRSFDDPLVQSDIPNWGFRVVDENGKPNIVIEEGGQDMLITPEQVSAMVLAKMKEAAEVHLEVPIFDVVITVPAYFTDAQRRATKDAATIAGLNVLRMINEPTAAAICYGTVKKFTKAQKILVFDLGGGTLDVSILIAEPNMKFTVMATHGDPHLGGKDFDNALARMLAHEYDQQHQEKAMGDPEAMQRLREACQNAKKTLSAGQSARIAIPQFLGGEAYQRTVTRAEFEMVCQDLFDAILLPVKAAIQDANLTAADIEDVVLVGGSSRIPKVKEILQKFFAGKKLLQSAHPDESVANGAAIYAASLIGPTNGPYQGLTLVDVTPFTLGIETYGGGMTVFFPKNTRLPAQMSHLFTTVFDRQESVKVQVFEGESNAAQHNRLLGAVILSGIEPAPRGTPQIMVTFDIDPSNILHVSAVNRRDGNKVAAQIDNDKYNLPRAEIQRIADSLAGGTPEDQLRAEQQALWKRLVEYKNGVVEALTNKGNKLSASELQRTTNSLQQLEDWMAKNRDASKRDIICKHQEASRDFRTVLLLLA